jgi:DNA invertase Pin-like site-specific DNA recombinase
MYLEPIAHFERRLISERTKDGLKAAKLRGKKLGRPNLDMEKNRDSIKTHKRW